jgi:hypothetical protein
MGAQTTTTKKKSPLLVIVIFLIAFCLICTGISVISNMLGLSPEPTINPVDIQDTAEAAVWLNLTKTAQAIPTATRTPTAVPLPTESPTPAPTLAPIILEGTGDSVVDVQKPYNPMIARIVYNGGRNFAIWNVDAGGNKIDLLVNTIGAYQGTVPIDFLQNQQTARFEITASDAWKIEILPLASARRENIPATIQGKGDDVIFFDGVGSPDLMTANATGSSNFVVWEYGTSRNLLIKIFNFIIKIIHIMVPNRDYGILDRSSLIRIIINYRNTTT